MFAKRNKKIDGEPKVETNYECVPPLPKEVVQLLK